MANIDQQMASSLRRIEAMLQAGAGVSEIRPILSQGAGSQVASHEVVCGYQRLLVNVYKLAPAKAAEEGADAAAKPAAKVGKASLSIAVKTPLPDGELYQIAAATVSKPGLTEIELPFCPKSLQLEIEVEGEAEYAVFGV